MGKKNVVWNDYISKNERFADFINGVVFHGERMVRPEELAALDTKLRRRERERDSYHEFIRDMVKVWEYQGQKFILGLEPEVPPEIRKPMEAFRNDFRISLWDIHGLESGDVFRTDLREVFGFLKRQGNKADLIRYVEGNEAFRHLQEDAFDVLSSYGGNAKLKLNKEDYRTKGGMDMCTALRELEEDAREEGRAEGAAWGNRLLTGMLERGLSLEKISELTGEPVEAIREAVSLSDGI